MTTHRSPRSTRALSRDTNCTFNKVDCCATAAASPTGAWMCVCGCGCGCVCVWSLRCSCRSVRCRCSTLAVTRTGVLYQSRHVFILCDDAHCSPLFLKDLRTDEDRVRVCLAIASGHSTHLTRTSYDASRAQALGTNKGLWKHLAPFAYPKQE